MRPSEPFGLAYAKGRKGADLAVPDAEAQRPVSDSESDRPADDYDGTFEAGSKGISPWLRP
jgi:hypothetical protein